MLYHWITVPVPPGVRAGVPGTLVHDTPTPHACPNPPESRAEAVTATDPSSMRTPSVEYAGAAAAAAPASLANPPVDSRGVSAPAFASRMRRAAAVGDTATLPPVPARLIVTVSSPSTTPSELAAEMVMVPVVCPAKKEVNPEAI